MPHTPGVPGAGEQKRLAGSVCEIWLSAISADNPDIAEDKAEVHIQQDHWSEVQVVNVKESKSSKMDDPRYDVCVQGRPSEKSELTGRKVK